MNKIIYLGENEFNTSVKISTLSALVYRAFGWTPTYSTIDSMYLPQNAKMLEMGLYEGSYSTYDGYIKSYRYLGYNKKGFVLPVECYDDLEESLRFTYDNIPENEIIWVSPTKYSTKVLTGKSFNQFDSVVLFDVMRQNHFYDSVKMTISGDAERMQSLELTRIFLSRTNSDKKYLTARKMFNMIENLRNTLYSPQYEDNHFIDIVADEIKYCKNRFNGHKFFVRAYLIDGSKYDMWITNEMEFADNIRIDDYKRIVDVKVNIVISSELIPYSAIEFYDLDTESGDADLITRVCYEPKYRNVEDLIETIVANDRHVWIKDMD